MDLLVVRLLFIAVVTLTCFVIKPFDLPAKMDAAMRLVSSVLPLFCSSGGCAGSA